MDWATRKRLVYFLGFFAIIFVVLIFIIYTVLNRPATCFDKKQNGSESGVDCGGTCAYLCQNSLTPLKIVWVRALPAGSKQVDLVAYLQNQNRTAGVARAPYKFTVYDDQGKVVYTKEGVTQIAPNGNIAIFVDPINIGERKVQNTLFEWTAPLLFSSATQKALSSNLETIDTKVTVGTTDTELVATLRNTTRLPYTKVPIVAILYDKDDNALLASRTIADEVLPNATINIFFSWKALPKETVSRIEILPYFEDLQNVK